MRESAPRICQVDFGSFGMATAAAAAKEEHATRFAKDQLKAIIERIERLEEEKKTISDDIRDVYAEGKGNGFDVKALRAIVRLRKQDPNERAGGRDHSRDLHAGAGDDLRRVRAAHTHCRPCERKDP